MGDYNPTAPYVMGEEFVGILEKTLTLANIAPGVEYGSRFITQASQQIADGRVYFTDGAQSLDTGQLIQVNVYPYGQEDKTGPIQSIVIPISTASNTASGSNRLHVIGQDGTSQTPPSVTSANIASALQSQSGNGSVLFVSPNSFTPDTLNLVVGFDVLPYLPYLTGKRILEVNILVQFSSGDDTEAIAASSPMSYYVLSAPPNGPVLENNILLAKDFQLQRIRLADVNFLWNGPTNYTKQSEQSPWNVTQLAQWAPTAAAATKLNVMFQRSGQVNTGTALTYGINYVALEVVYCEETRVASGNILFQGPSNGLIIVPMRDMNFVASPTLPAGTYTVTVAAPYQRDGLNNGHNTANLAPIAALQSLYAMPTHVGRQITKPVTNFPEVGTDSFSVTDTDVLPQLSLHGTTGTVVPNVHVYGRRIEIPIYDQVTATQVIKNNTGIPSNSNTQARFYARRFGVTDQPLLMTLGAATASITPAAFDVLPEIVDGWREVTLTMSQTFTFTPGQSSNCIFSATGLAAGNRWEILGVTAPAISGVPGNPYNRVPTAQNLTTATYNQPNGDVVNLTWHSPAISGTAEAPDNESDLVVMLAQNLPAPTSITVTQPSQSLTTVIPCVGQTQPEAVPTGLTYNRVTWVSPVVTGIGFGFMDLERFDTVDNTWQVIMRASSLSVTGFSDYEARIGVQSSYRMRVANALGFFGSYSATGTGTIAAPGVSGKDVASSILTFTTNEHQAGGSNLAYGMALDSPQEDLTFPEASRNKLQWMYGKDYQNAFHPLERGGEQFTRALLVAQMAIPATGPQIQRAFQPLRDLAWSTVSYVCVRNELGDRWFANVAVPNGSLFKGRTIQIVQAQITETRTNPSMVDPVTQQ